MPSRHGISRFALFSFALGLAGAGRSFAQSELPSLSEPAMSPDGSEIAFASGGDIWTVPARGGEAHLLVTHPATESRPMYSPDGNKMAFVSTRTGGGNLYVLTLATGHLDRLTYSDSPEQMDGWSRDGRWLYFTSSVNDIAGQGDIFRVSVDGGTPLEVSRERYLSEFASAPSPDGQTLAVVARGLSNRQWWRNGHAHIDESEIWLKPTARDGGYRRLVASGAKHLWPMWSVDGGTLFMMSDASGAENLWSVPVAGGAPKQLTHFSHGRVLWPTISYDGRTIVFERDFRIWRYDVMSGRAEQVAITLRGLPASPGTTHLNETNFSRMVLSPDGNKVAVIAHGEVFAVSAKDGGEAQRVTRTVAEERSPEWSPDSLKLVYVSERSGQQQVFWYDFVAGTERALTEGAAEVSEVRWSPDGKAIAYLADSKQLHVVRLGEKGEVGPDTVVAKGAMGDYGQGSVAWSPDSQWLAFTLLDSRSFTNLEVVPAKGGEMRPLTFLANGETGSKIAWSPDGRYLLFDTAQRSEQVQIARVDLLPHVPKYREDEFRELFRPNKQPGVTPPTFPGKPDSVPAPAKTDEPRPEPTTDVAKVGREAKGDDGAKPADAAKKKPEPVRIVFEGIRERLTLLPLGLSAEDPVISPDGKELLFSARTANQQALYTYSLDELAKEPPQARQLTSTPGAKSDFSFTSDSKSAYFLENGAIHSIALEGRTPKTIAANATMEVDFDAEKMVVFEEAWSTLGRDFFDPRFNGQDWKGLHDTWKPYLAGTRTPDEMRRDINLMIGELNASHSGISAGGRGPVPRRVGDLGLRFDRFPYEAGKGLVVREVIALGPAAIEGSIQPGDRLVSVNGVAIEAHTNLDQLLLDTIDHRVELAVVRAGKTRQVVVRPVSGATAGGLLYRQWVSDRRELVERVSGGKIGYVHIADMSDNSLRQLYLDLDAQNESRQGVVIDIRNNNGGYVNGYVLDVFTRRNYLTMTPRDLFPMPSRQSLGQRALGLPTVLVTNESSLSDAEDFTEGYRSLHLGEVVGQPTAGWIIFTSGTQLIDGSALRLPEVRIEDLRGETMEMHPRPVDVEVERPLGETEDGRDAQLERAVKELMHPS